MTAMARSIEDAFCKWQEEDAAALLAATGVESSQELSVCIKNSIRAYLIHPSSEVVVRFYFATKFSSEIVSPRRIPNISKMS